MEYSTGNAQGKEIHVRSLLRGRTEDLGPTPDEASAFLTLLMYIDRSPLYILPFKQVTRI